MQKLKGFIRKADNPVVQLANRLIKFDRIKYKSDSKQRFSTTGSTRSKDNCFLLANKQKSFYKRNKKL